MTIDPRAYPKAARLIKAGEFSSVFALRPVQRSCHPVLYVHANGDRPAHLGVVIGKRLARRAVERSLIKRQRRELFHLRQSLLGGRGVLVRPQARFPRQDVPVMVAFRRICREELVQLFEVATRPLLASPAATSPQPTAGSTPRRVCRCFCCISTKWRSVRLQERNVASFRPVLTTRATSCLLTGSATAVILWQNVYAAIIRSYKADMTLCRPLSTTLCPALSIPHRPT